MEGVKTPCEACHGRRFKDEVLAHKLDGLSVSDVLAMTVAQALPRFKQKDIAKKKGSLYVMDEPTTGLHMADVGHLLAIMDRLVDAGNTVLVIEHNLDIVRHADWVIDMGPDGGTRGGQVIFEGTPAPLRDDPRSITGRYLR